MASTLATYTASVNGVFLDYSKGCVKILLSLR